jgi:cellulose synthase/poly-beta-1,6-N-acetylglucosamine synthase-like glycosyltransferase
MQILLLAAYCSVLIVLCTYGAHRAMLVFQCLRHRRRIAVAERTLPVNEAELPTVTVQLPIYNEATVAARLIEATGKLDYPHAKLEIQVLDDSTDETLRIARDAVAALVARGLDAKHVRRPTRHGYKAGALDFGLKTARGELIAIFDADFVPQPDFLRLVVGHFQDARVGMVQTRWGHMNRDRSLFTQVQALMLDGHHMVENRARFGAGHMFNFSGTGGIWRRAAIDAAGGWQHDTLTEDLDLSYRAQMAGYRFVYRSDVVTPSELPEDISAFRAQQFRWAKGTVQTARKLLKRVVTAKLPLGQRIEACFHMLPHFAYPMMVLLSMLLLPALICMPATDLRTMLLIDLPLCFGATGSIATFYITAEVAQGRSGWGAAKRLPALIALGAGLAPHLTAAVFDGLTKMAGEFVRTPKRGTAAGRYFQHAKLPLIEMALCLVSSASVVASIETSHYFATPFAALFTLGYGYVASQVLIEQLGRPVPAPDRISSADAEDLPGLAA